MFDQGYNLHFFVKKCELRNIDYVILVGRVIRTLGNVYILIEIQGEKSYIG